MQFVFDFIPHSRLFKQINKTDRCDLCEMLYKGRYKVSNV